jgi:hypothetical protein
MTDRRPSGHLGIRPAEIPGLPGEALQGLLVELHALQVAVVARLSVPATAPAPARPAPDRRTLLTPDQAAEILGVTRRWVYAHADELEGKRFSRKCLRIPLAAVERRLAEQKA